MRRAARVAQSEKLACENASKSGRSAEPPRSDSGGRSGKGRDTMYCCAVACSSEASDELPDAWLPYTCCREHTGKGPWKTQRGGICCAHAHLDVRVARRPAPLDEPRIARPAYAVVAPQCQEARERRHGALVRRYGGRGGVVAEHDGGERLAAVQGNV